MQQTERRSPLGSTLEGRIRPARFSAVVIASVLLLLTSPSRAQREPGALGVGFQIGRPGGLALKFYRPGPVAYDGVISTDGDDYVAGHFHRLWDHPLPNSPLHFYFGPGLMIGPGGLSQSPRLRLGLSGEAGLNFYAERVEVFLHVTPTLRFLPDTRIGLDGNFGLRYYLPSF